MGTAELKYFETEYSLTNVKFVSLLLYLLPVYFTFSIWNLMLKDKYILNGIMLVGQLFLLLTFWRLIFVGVINSYAFQYKEVNCA